MCALVGVINTSHSTLKMFDRKHQDKSHNGKRKDKDFSDGGRKRQEVDELRERKSTKQTKWSVFSSNVRSRLNPSQKDCLAAHLLQSLLFYGVDANAVPSSVMALTPPLGVTRERVNLRARKICISVCA